MILKAKAKLVIIDSVASLIRKEFDGDSTTERNDMLSKEATILKYVASFIAWRSVTQPLTLTHLTGRWLRGFLYLCWCQIR